MARKGAHSTDSPEPDLLSTVPAEPVAAPVVVTEPVPEPVVKIKRGRRTTVKHPEPVAPTATAPESMTTAITPAKPEPAALARTGGLDMQGMFDKALAAGPEGVASLKDLVALHQQIQDRDAKKQYGEALAAFQAEVPVITKNKEAKIASRTGTGYTYKYADLASLTATIRPLLTKHGLSYSFGMTLEGGVATITVTLRHVAGHSETSGFPCAVASPNPGMSLQQQAGGAYTFAQRYALIGMLGLTTAEDDLDGKEAEPQVPFEPLTQTERHNLLCSIDALDGDKQRNLALFLKAFGVENIDAIPKSRLKEAQDRIEERRKRGGGR